MQLPMKRGFSLENENENGKSCLVCFYKCLNKKLLLYEVFKRLLKYTEFKKTIKH